MSFAETMLAAPPDKAANPRLFDAGATRVIHMLPSEGEVKILPMLEQFAEELL